MSKTRLPIGTVIQIEKPDLQAVVDKLKELGYKTVGPRIFEQAIVYGELDSVDMLPIGYVDEQDGGTYRIRKTDTGAYFDYVVGPHSLKNYLFPPRETILESQREGKSWTMRAPVPPQQPLAVIGVRSCDLHALAIQDRVFLGGPYVDTAYQQRRQALFVVAVNCRRAARTCFCHSMNTGPTVTKGFDLALTEMDEYFAVEVGTERGGEVISGAAWTPCSVAQVEQSRSVPQQLEERMRNREPESNSVLDEDGPRQRSLDTSDIRNLLMNNLDHPRWEEVAERCLSCANCTMVCPTCFCSSVDEVSDLSGDNVRRERAWDSCFTAEHSYMNTGTVRKTTQSRYRQWMTHKLATWHDQFDTSGCVGCGRCITWCPVGIDLTEEVAAIRGDGL